MEKLNKLPSSPGIANSIGKSNRDRHKGRNEEDLEKARKRQKKENRDEAASHDQFGGEPDLQEQASEGNERGNILDEKV
jgi:hypothetical protein